MAMLSASELEQFADDGYASPLGFPARRRRLPRRSPRRSSTSTRPTRRVGASRCCAASCTAIHCGKPRTRLACSKRSVSSSTPTLGCRDRTSGCSSCGSRATSTPATRAGTSTRASRPRRHAGSSTTDRVRADAPAVPAVGRRRRRRPPRILAARICRCLALRPFGDDGVPGCTRRSANHRSDRIATGEAGTTSASVLVHASNRLRGRSAVHRRSRRSRSPALQLDGDIDAVTSLAPCAPLDADARERWTARRAIAWSASGSTAKRRRRASLRRRPARARSRPALDAGATRPRRRWCYSATAGRAHKRQGYIVALARRLVRHHGFAAAAIDGPVHGERRQDPRQCRRVRASREMWRDDPTMTDEMVADWRAVLDALQSPAVLGSVPVGWWGLSMGTILGLPVVRPSRGSPSPYSASWASSVRTKRSPRRRCGIGDVPGAVPGAVGRRAVPPRPGVRIVRGTRLTRQADAREPGRAPGRSRRGVRASDAVPRTHARDRHVD